MATPDVIVFIGLQGSGKSTFYQRRFAGTHRHISKDNFRNARNRARRQERLIAEALDAGHAVVVDNTNPQREDRQAIIAQAHAFGTPVTGYYFIPDIAGSLARNRQRTGKAQVPDNVIFMTAAKLEPPVPAEGFDRLFQVHVADGDFVVTPWPISGAPLPP